MAILIRDLLRDNHREVSGHPFVSDLRPPKQTAETNARTQTMNVGPRCEPSGRYWQLLAEREQEIPEVCEAVRDQHPTKQRAEIETDTGRCAFGAELRDLYESGPWCGDDGSITCASICLYLNRDAGGV